MRQAKADVEREAINNRYHIKRPLGRGGMGAVYLVEDLKEDRRLLALKCFRPRRQKPEDVDLFKHEFLLLSKLRHPNVAAVHDFGVIEGQGDYFFTTDFVDGKDLLHASEAFGWADFYEALAQVCRGLGYIHSRQLIHYDIKPTNVLIEPVESGGFIAKIIDFGLAESAHEEGLGSVRGTVSYMAPEVGRSGAIDRRADLYSLGVTLFHCATRTLPFRGSTNLDVIRAHIKRAPPDPRELRPDIPPAFARLITRLMAKDPSDRFDSADEVIRAVGELGARTFAIETRAGAVSYVHSGRFIGRERAFDLLRHTFEEAFGTTDDEDPSFDSSVLFPGFAALDSSSKLDEQANLIFVTGGAGSGKSRLLREFRHHVQLSRVALCEGQGSPEAPSYQPFTEAFRSLLGLWGDGPARSDRLRRRLIRRHGAELSKILPELSGEALDDRPVALSPDRERLRLFDHLSRFLLEFARSRPLVLYLHDLQHVDEATTAFLEYLARNLELARRRAREDGEPARLMIVASYRDEGLGPIDAAAERLERDGEARSIRLQNFSRGQTDELLSSMLGGESFPSELVSRIHTETAGNPYFIVELMRSLVEGGSLRNMGGRWALPEAAEDLRLPRSARDAILERLARLGEDELEPLRVLAVYGRPTTAHRFAQLIERPVEDVLTSLESLVARQILGRSQRGEEREYAFLHQLVTDALYAKVPEDERRRLHARCGDFLERSFPGLAHQNPGELVRHFLLGGDRRRALDYSVKAADAAKAVHANGRAIEFFREALSCLDEDGPDPRRARLLEHLGLVQALTGDYSGARASFKTVLEDSPDLAATDRARIFRELGEVEERRGDYEAALSAFSDGLRGLGKEVRSQQGAKLLAATGSIYIKKGRFDLAIAFCESGLELLTGFPEEEDTAAIRTILGVAHSCKGDLSAAEREFEVSLELRRRSRHQLGIAQTLTNLGAVAMERGLTDLAVARFEQALTLHERLGHRQGVAEAATHLGRALGHLGQAERAANLHRRALAIKERIGDLEGLVATQNDLGALMLERARYAEARRHFAEARERNRRLGEVREEARALNGEAELFLICGRIAESETAASEALRSATVHELLREQGRAYRSLGLVAAERGDSDRAERLLQRSLTIFARSESAGDVARVTMDLIELALEQRNGEFAQMAIARLSDDGGVPESGRLRTRFELCAAGIGGLSAELEDAIATARQAIEGARRTEDREALWRAHLVHGELREDRGELEAALAAYVEAMETLRGIHDALDGPLREGFLTLARRRRLKERFRGLRARIA